jgi:UDP-N-acetyl-D-galactosamine dehydrogenase
VDLIPFDEAKDADCVIVAVGHKEFRSLSMSQLKEFFKEELADDEKILIDVKSWRKTLWFYNEYTNVL